MMARKAQSSARRRCGRPDWTGNPHWHTLAWAGGKPDFRPAEAEWQRKGGKNTMSVYRPKYRGVTTALPPWQVPRPQQVLHRLQTFCKRNC
jgi:hypothetical protein